MFEVVVYCIAFFIYLSDGFELFPNNDLGGATEIKRMLQYLMAIPILLVSLYCIYLNSSALLKPFVIFILIKLAVDITTGFQPAFILEGILIFVSLIVLHTLPHSFVEKTIRIWINIAVIFASLALIKIFMGMLNPAFLDNSSLLFLGRSTELVEIGPISFGRSSSYASEPSLNVLFFLMPAIASLLLNNTIRNNSFVILVSFCLLSFSGSIILSIGVSFFIFPFLKFMRFFDLRIFFPYFIFIIFFFYLGILSSIDSNNFSENLDFSNINNSFNKSVSFEIRALWGAMNVKALLTHPFGLSFASKEAINIPGPMLVSVGLAGGWISIAIFISFLVKLSNKMYLYRKLNQANTVSNVSTALLIGAMFNFIIFNDYLIINYNGLVILTFISYLIDIQPKRLQKS
jgi:hypothetical protein